ncbi:MAG: hypothetical protein CFH10_00708 [Alphaproteobacteria bacterium MarineAlpha4_Bin2]|nr:MAG: hypothetical protein CFH10_00708 [Alphaproteobacteria bacterium MarineAlpha4_Bin2]|tara:strand:- start:330 stop:548 length:219 start_codon:yes stop_codon:yes gene_type:complete
MEKYECTVIAFLVLIAVDLVVFNRINRNAYGATEPGGIFVCIIDLTSDHATSEANPKGYTSIIQVSLAKQAS